MVMLGETRQTALERHRNVGNSEIEHNLAEAARAQESLSRPRNVGSIQHADNGQRGKIHSTVGYVGGIKKTLL